MPRKETILMDPEPAEAQGTSVAVPAAPRRRTLPTKTISKRETLIFYLVLAVVGVLWKEEWRTAALRYWWASLAILAALLAVLLVPYTRTWLERVGTSARIAVPVFGVPLLVLFSLFIPKFPQYQFYALRLPYLILVTLLPGVMFYLFMVNRKTSLLNEFIANLDRLGVLAAPPVSDVGPISKLQEERYAYYRWWRRVTSYVRKFEAIYGCVSPEVLQQAFEGAGTVTVPGAPSSQVAATAASFGWPEGAGIVPGSSSSPEAEKASPTETKIPVVVSTLLIALGWLVTLPLQRPATGDTDWMSALSLDHSTPLHFAFLGAYFFSLQMLFRRYVLRDLRPSAYMAISIRIILAVIGTWIVTAAADGMGLMRGKSSLLIVGFVIGVFPPVVWQFVQSAFKKIGAGFVLPSLQSQLPISDLDGLTVWHESRLEEEGIENIPNMAMADIVELMVQTRLPAEQIIDWVDQAILYTNLGPQPEKKKDGASPRQRLRAQGIRTATSLQVSYERCTPGSDREAFEKVLSAPDGSAVRSPMRSLVDTLTTNSNLELVRAWKGLPESPDKPNKPAGPAL